MLLRDKVVLITGAARGIGRVAALVMADEGADVAVADILPEVEAVAEEVRRRGTRSVAAVFDIADPSQVHEKCQEDRAGIGPHPHPRKQRGDRQQYCTDEQDDSRGVESRDFGEPVGSIQYDQRSHRADD